MPTILCKCARPSFCFSRGTDILGSLVLNSLLDFNWLILINLTHPMKSSHCLFYKQSWRVQLKLSPLLYHYKTYKITFPSHIHKLIYFRNDNSFKGYRCSSTCLFVKFSEIISSIIGKLVEHLGMYSSDGNHELHNVYVLNVGVSPYWVCNMMSLGYLYCEKLNRFSNCFKECWCLLWFLTGLRSGWEEHRICRI